MTMSKIKLLIRGGDMNVDDIPLDIDIDIDIDTDSSTTSEPIILKTDKASDIIFSLLSNIEHLNSAKKFYIKLRPSEHTF